MADLIWGWKSIRDEIGKTLGYEPDVRTLQRWTEPGVIDTPLPVKSSKLGRVFIKTSDLVAWCRKVTQ